jgi:CBS domain-containing protein
MQYHGIAALIVMDDGRLVGILSEGDIVHAISRYGGAALQITVSHIVGSTLITVTPQDSVKKAMNLMTNNRIRHLPVLEKGCLAGIVSLGDLVKHTLHELELEANVLRDIYVAAR